MCCASGSIAASTASASTSFTASARTRGFPTSRPRWGRSTASGIQNEPVTHELIRGFRRLVDGYPGERTTVGEVNLRRLASIGSYYGHGDELHMVFNFLPLHAPWTKGAWQDMIERVERELPRAPGRHGCCRTTTSAAFEPGWAARTRRGRRP